ncbi:MAG: cation:proton antiporter [Planctomycetota bacterium]
MHPLDFVIFSAFALVFGLVAQRLERTPLTAPILAVGLGLVLGPLGLNLSRLDVEGSAVRVMAEFTLAFVLFHDAARIDLRVLRRNLAIPGRLLGPGLLMTIALGAALGSLVLGRDGIDGAGLGPWDIALLAALLAPTDAALGQAVVSQEAVPARVRQALNVESGLNDGLVVPIVATLLACAAGASAQTELGLWTFARHALQAAGFGVAFGLVIGFVSARLMDLAHAAGWMHHTARHGAIAAVPVLAYFGAELVHGSGFLAAFVAGLTLGSVARRLERRSFDFTEDLGELLGHVTWITFGVAAAPFALSCASPAVLGYALLSLTVVRMLPVALALMGTGFARDTVLFIGWFGPRGLATVVFALTALSTPELVRGEQVFGVAVWVVLLSVLLHGLTASALARRYGARCGRRQEFGTAAEHQSAPELPFDRRPRLPGVAAGP